MKQWYTLHFYTCTIITNMFKISENHAERDRYLSLILLMMAKDNTHAVGLNCPPNGSGFSGSDTKRSAVRITLYKWRRSSSTRPSHCRQLISSLNRTFSCYCTGVQGQYCASAEASICSPFPSLNHVIDMQQIESILLAQ